MSKARQTQWRLQEVAIRLFAARGFDNVTVADVADAAGVSHMTFFRHFPTKESVVLADPYDPAIGRAVGATDPRLPPARRVALGLQEAWSQVVGPDDELVRTRMSIAAQAPSIWARVWQNNLRTEGIVATALTETGVDPFEARVTAGAFLGGLLSALIDWGASDTTESLGERIGRTLALLAALPEQVAL